MDQALGDGQAQASATILAGCRNIGLRKSFKDAVELVRRDANPCVLYPKLQPLLPIRQDLFFDVNVDSALLGELDGIADQVDQDLPQPRRVAHDHGGRRIAKGTRNQQVFLIGSGTQNLKTIIDRLVQVVRGLLDVDFAGLDF